MEFTESSEIQSHNVAIAHLSNIAEAGYFSDELFRHRQIDSTIDVENQFNALLGDWSARYVIYVASNRAASSREFLQEMSQAHRIEEEYADDRHDDIQANSAYRDGGLKRSNSFDRQPDSRTASEEASRIHWVPFVLTLTAGSFFFWGFLQWNRNRPNDRHQIPHHSRQFWDDVSSPQRKWYQRLNNGRTRELEFDPKSGEARIREFDGRGLLKIKRYDLSEAAGH